MSKVTLFQSATFNVCWLNLTTTGWLPIQYCVNSSVEAQVFLVAKQRSQAEKLRRPPLCFFFFFFSLLLFLRHWSLWQPMELFGEKIWHAHWVHCHDHSYFAPSSATNWSKLEVPPRMRLLTRVVGEVAKQEVSWYLRNAYTYLNQIWHLDY